MILHGSIVDGDRVVDEVVVGCEGPQSFVIHCHGNPLLTEQIVNLLQSHGAALTDAEDFIFQKHRMTSENLIEAEAKLVMQQCTTLMGVSLLQEQTDGGLSAWAKSALDDPASMDTEELQRQCSEILQHSKIARHFIEGVRIVIAGPPNSGKSTLLNCLAGQQQAIVSDTVGTTRDWVSVKGRLGPIWAEIIDTAGLDTILAGNDEVELAAQAITKKLLDSCDLILYVQDVKTGVHDHPPVFNHCTVPVVYVLNKCDLHQEHKDMRRQGLRNIFISARNNERIKELVCFITEALGVTDFDRSAPIVFTKRQKQLLAELIDAPHSCKDMLRQLLHG